MSDDDFFAFLDACRKELTAKQADFTSSIADDAKWHYDLDTGCLRIGDRAFAITAIGTHNSELQTWLWAWGNDTFPACARDASAAIRSLFDVTGFNVFTDPGINASSQDAQDFAACAIHTLDAVGLYRCPGEATLYLAVHQP